jgi:branched-chain amino acid transport system ATP-binding protein
VANMLEIKQLSVNYDKSKALDNVSLHVQEGEIVSIVGANGAGKTTLVRTICGLKRPASGEIWFQDKRIDRLAVHVIVKEGIVQVPAGRMIINNMSVLHNLRVGAYLRKDRNQVKKDMQAMFEYFPVLKEKQSQLGGDLSGGQQQMLAVARALMANPKLLLMDEPSVGLSPILVAEVSQIIRDIHQRGISILLIEQNCRMALKLANRAYILQLGAVALEGPASELVDDEMVKKSYLGG